MKKELITKLRDVTTAYHEFRSAADQLATVLAIECDRHLCKTTTFVSTPLAKTSGVRLQYEPLLVAILRSGIAMISPFLRFYPSAPIGFIGIHRDEKTAKPKQYYENIPKIHPQQPIFLLDPMIATGGSASKAVSILKKSGATAKQITLVSFIASSEGLAKFQKTSPEATVIVAQVDDQMNKNHFIVPGLGDFGDRYFRT